MALHQLWRGHRRRTGQDGRSHAAYAGHEETGTALQEPVAHEEMMIIHVLVPFSSVNNCNKL